MLLLRELNEECEVLVEESTNNNKNYYIHGICLQGAVKNRNGRIYPENVLDREAARFQEYVKNGSAMACGELSHPTSRPALEMKEASHIMKELRKDGTNWYGKAKILDTPNGKIVKNFMDEGIKFGFSSRGLGSLVERNGTQYVGEDYRLTVISDIVADPSGPDCMANALMESADWIFENGLWKQSQLESAQNTIKKASKKELEATKLQVFENLMMKLSKQ